jgi:hypothetical protein
MNLESEGLEASMQKPSIIKSDPAFSRKIVEIT